MEPCRLGSAARQSTCSGSGPPWIDPESRGSGASFFAGVQLSVASIQVGAVSLSSHPVRLPKKFYACRFSVDAFSFSRYAYRFSGYAYNFFGKPAKKFAPIPLLRARVQLQAARVQSLVVRVKLFWYAYQKTFTHIASTCTRAAGLCILATFLDTPANFLVSVQVGPERVPRRAERLQLFWQA